MLEKPCCIQMRVILFASRLSQQTLGLGSVGVLRFTVKPSDVDSFVTTKESLRSPDSPDIGWISTTIAENKSSVADLPDKVIEMLANPVKLSPLQEEFLALHERL